MKSTYKLLGVEWDHAPLPTTKPIFSENKVVEPYTTKRNLFDLDKYERKIDLSDIFSSSTEELITMINTVKYCDSIYLNIDYEPSSQSNDIRSFYYLRILQVIAYFEEKLTDKNVMVLGSESAKEGCLKIWNNKQLQYEAEK